jgi:hypothetical protein
MRACPRAGNAGPTVLTRDAALLDPEFLKLGVEMLAVDLQQSGGLGLVALGARQCARDEQALQLSRRRFRWHHQQLLEARVDWV